jgi:CRISPR/Cas system CSM-associated protein Csm3 (group 7 of RAMP superfamily)
MFKKAEELNLTRPRDDQAKYLAHMGLGRRGERGLRQVKVRIGEIISPEGRVII